MCGPEVHSGGGGGESGGGGPPRPLRGGNDYTAP